MKKLLAAATLSVSVGAQSGQPLVLRDVGQSLNGREGTTGFSVEISTDDQTLRVVAHANRPKTTTSPRMMALASSVTHVVLRSATKTSTIQPASEQKFEDNARNGLGNMLEFNGVTATFPLNAVKALRSHDQEFYVVVIGERNREKEFKVKQKHFDQLP